MGVRARVGSVTGIGNDPALHPTAWASRGAAIMDVIVAQRCVEYVGHGYGMHACTRWYTLGDVVRGCLVDAHNLQ